MSAGPYGRHAYALGLAGGMAERVEPFAGGHVVRRPIAGGDLFDVAGPYPLLGLAADPAGLADDLARLRAQGAVSLTAVLDPLHRPDDHVLRARFDHAAAFKRHFVVRPGAAMSRHHAQEIRRARRRCVVQAVDFAAHRADWERLYRGLEARHDLDPADRLPPSHFRQLAEDPMLMALAAFDADGEAVAMSLWLCDGDTAYSHLAASSPEGYRIAASYALYDEALRRFAGCRAINLGGVPGARDDPEHGLARFKAGFGGVIQTAWLVGAILDPLAYAGLVERFGGGATRDYFPRYRFPGQGQ